MCLADVSASYVALSIEQLETVARVSIWQNLISSDRAPQGERNGAYFSFVAPSSNELWVQKKCD